MKKYRNKETGQIVEAERYEETIVENPDFFFSDTTDIYYDVKFSEEQKLDMETYILGNGYNAEGEEFFILAAEDFERNYEEKVNDALQPTSLKD